MNSNVIVHYVERAFTAANHLMRLPSVLPGVTLLDLPQVNVWLLHSDSEAALIDTGLYWDRRRLMRALTTALAGRRLTSILLTHGHCDHAGNAAFLSRRFGARIVLHQDEAPYVCSRKLYGKRGLQRIMFAVGEVVFPVRRLRQPPVEDLHGLEPECDRYVAGLVTVVVDGERIDSPIGALTVVHTPGHTPGHASYFHEESGWLFSGDAILNVVPFVRREALTLSVPVFSSDMEQARESALKLVGLAPCALLSGHGHPHLNNTAEELRAFGESLS